MSSGDASYDGFVENEDDDGGGDDVGSRNPFEGFDSAKFANMLRMIAGVAEGLDG
jgi:hypothetical protein